MTLCLLLQSCQQTEELTAVISGADAAYERGRYKEALGAYDALVAEGYGSKKLYTNAGLSAYESEQYAEAILYFEKARKWGRNNKVINSAIENCQKKLDHRWTDLKGFFLLNWGLAIRDMWRSTIWAVLSILFAFAASMSYYFLHTERESKLPRSAPFVMSFLCMVSLIFGAWRAKYEFRPNEGVITEASQELYAAPESIAKTIRKIPPGTKVKTRDQLGEWRLIILPNLEEGWVKEEVIRFI